MLGGGFSRAWRLCVEVAHLSATDALIVVCGLELSCKSVDVVGQVSEGVACTVENLVELFSIESLRLVLDSVVYMNSEGVQEGNGLLELFLVATADFSNDLVEVDVLDDVAHFCNVFVGVLDCFTQFCGDCICFFSVFTRYVGYRENSDESHLLHAGYTFSEDGVHEAVVGVRDEVIESEHLATLFNTDGEEFVGYFLDESDGVLVGDCSLEVYCLVEVVSVSSSVPAEVA